MTHLSHSKLYTINYLRNIYVHIKKQQVEPVLASLLLVLLCINLSWTQGPGQINLMLCAAMCLSPLVLLLRSCRVWLPRTDIPLLLVCFFVMVFPFLFHPDSVRLSTMLFTCAYCVTMMMLVRLILASRFSASYIMLLIRWLVYAFTLCIVIQQCCLLAGVPMFNDSMHDFHTPGKINSLATEASYSSITLVLLLTVYCEIYRKSWPDRGFFKMVKSQPLFFICWIWANFTTGNATGYALWPICLVPWIRRRDLWKWVLGGAVFLTLLFTVIDRQVLQFARISMFVKPVARGDYNEFIRISTASYRVMPTIYGAEAMVPPTLEWLTGHGVDADRFETPPRPWRQPRPDVLYGPGCAGIFSIAYNYGVPCALAFWWAIGALVLVWRRPSTWLLFLYAIFLSTDFNVPLCWMVMAWCYVYKSMTNYPSERETEIEK